MATHSSVDEASTLAATHDSHGSDIGLCGGLLGFDLSDERLRNYENEMQKSGMQIQFDTGRYGDFHPNIPHEFKCTALGGLSVTPTSKQIQAQLKTKRQFSSTCSKFSHEKT